jgi:hypothetical protein
MASPVVVERVATPPPSQGKQVALSPASVLQAAEMSPSGSHAADEQAVLRQLLLLAEHVYVHGLDCEVPESLAQIPELEQRSAPSVE